MAGSTDIIATSHLCCPPILAMNCLLCNRERQERLDKDKARREAEAAAASAVPAPDAKAPELPPKMCALTVHSCVLGRW